MKTIVAIIILSAVLFGGWYFINNSNNIMENPTGSQNQPNPKLTLYTNKGNITLELFVDKAPLTAGNFLKLAQEGFYDGTKFHRTIPNFMIQGGDPNSKLADTSVYGRGGPGYTIKDEFAPGLSNNRGTISMANAGPNTGGSQFFINTVNNDYLDGRHAVFGNVISGMDIVDEISKVKTGPSDIPLEAVIVNRISVN